LSYRVEEDSVQQWAAASPYSRFKLARRGARGHAAPPSPRIEPVNAVH